MLALNVKLSLPNDLRLGDRHTVFSQSVKFFNQVLPVLGFHLRIVDLVNVKFLNLKIITLVKRFGSIDTIL